MWPSLLAQIQFSTLPSLQLHDLETLSPSEPPGPLPQPREPWSQLAVGIAALAPTSPPQACRADRQAPPHTARSLGVLQHAHPQEAAPSPVFWSKEPCSVEGVQAEREENQLSGSLWPGPARPERHLPCGQWGGAT